MWFQVKTFTALALQTLDIILNNPQELDQDLLLLVEIRWARKLQHHPRIWYRIEIQICTRILRKINIDQTEPDNNLPKMV